MDVQKTLNRIDREASRFHAPSAVAAHTDRRTGRKHGKAGQPPGESSHHPYLRALRDQVRQDFGRIARRLGACLNQADRELQQLERKRNGEIADQRRQIEEERDAARDRVDKQHGPRSTRYAHAQAELDKAFRLEKDIADALDRLPQNRIPLWLYVLILVGIAVGELPVNQGAFTQIVPGMNIASGLVALVIGMLTAATAHLVGEMLKHARYRPGFRANRGRYLGSAAIVVVMAVLFYFIAHLRQAVLRLQETAEAGVQGAFEQGAFTQSVAQGLGIDGLGMMAVNLAIFAFGILASWMAHDAHEDYLPAVRRHTRARKRMHKLDSTYQNKLDEVERTYTPRLNELDNRIVGLDQEIEGLDRQRHEIVEHWRRAAQAAATYLAKRVATYEDANMTARTSPLPAAFGTFDDAAFTQELHADARPDPNLPRGDGPARGDDGDGDEPGNGGD